MMRTRNLAIACLVALLVVYCGMTLFASACNAVNPSESVLLGLKFCPKNSATDPGFDALGDPIDDPRPH